MTFSDVAQSYRKPWFTLPAACYSHSRLSLFWWFLSRLLTALTGGALPLTAKLGIYTTNLLHARLASTTMLQQTQQHEDMRSAASSQSRVSTPVSWTVTRSPAQGTRRMILVYQIGIAHRVSLQGVKLAKSGSQYEFSAADPRTCQCLRITRLRKCTPSASAGCRPGRYLLMTERMCRHLVVCARCFAEVCVYTQQSRPLDGRTSRTSGTLDSRLHLG